MRAAYADPPYLGLAKKFYGHLHPEAADYDKLETHARLVERMMDEYDTWAMSLHVPAMREILGVCPADVRIAAWVKPFASFKKGVTRAWTWEPVIFSFHRARSGQRSNERGATTLPSRLRCDADFAERNPSAFAFGFSRE